MNAYREIAPPPRLARHVECFWRGRAPAQPFEHRVLPDGCTDLVFWFTGSDVRGAVVGAMTHPLVSPMDPGTEVMGVRFHPGMSHGLLRAPLPMLTDQVIDLESLWGKDARQLEQRLADAATPRDRVEALGAAIEPADAETPVQRAALWIVENRGDAAAETLARHAGLSARQFRRLCLEQTGMAPKLLCRVVRFRNAASDVAARIRATAQVASWADFALEHGYYDQAHFINEFREFSGLTPVEYATVFSNPAALSEP